MRARTSQVCQSMVVPQGFTLSIAGSLGTLLGERGYPGALAVWLFVLGGGVGFCTVTGFSGVHGDAEARPEPVTGPALFNLLPVTVVPTVFLTAGLIGSDRLAFAVAGFLVVILYLIGMAGLIRLLDRPFRRVRLRRARSAPRTDREAV
jgi:hypothetical protein